MSYSEGRPSREVSVERRGLEWAGRATRMQPSGLQHSPITCHMVYARGFDYHRIAQDVSKYACQFWRGRRNSPQGSPGQQWAITGSDNLHQ